jgi:hypothetical protein
VHARRVGNNCQEHQPREDRPSTCRAHGKGGMIVNVHRCATGKLGIARLSGNPDDGVMQGIEIVLKPDLESRFLGQVWQISSFAQR